jgi:hypothetical protein
MITLGLLHYVYIVMTIIIIVALLLKKEIVLPCVVGIFLMGLAFSGGNPIKATQVLYNSFVASGTEFLGIIVVIALVVSMSRTLASIGADEIMIRPLKNAIKSQRVAFFVVGFVMLIASWFIWPSPAVALVGALLLPFAIKSGLPAIWAAVAMNIFGHGMGLSGDYFIQGAPGIAAKAAGITTPAIMKASLPLWIVMSVVTVTASFFMFSRDIKRRNGLTDSAAADEDLKLQAEKTHSIQSDDKSGQEIKITRFSYFIAILTPLAFVVDVVLMIMFNIVGGDATALVGGTAVLIMTIILIGKGNLADSLDEITDKFKAGFIFAMKIFAPVIIIAGFFFLGSGEMAAKILGEGAPNILHDLGMYLSNIVPEQKAPIAIMQALIAMITGLDGSGFSGLPLVGSLAQTFALATNASVEVLAALGQLITVWVGGGTIIPWGVIPVAAICNVKPAELARKNLIPVLLGITATVIAAIVMMQFV